MGLNLALHYLSGSITFDPAVTAVDSTLASQIVWLDCLLTNVDRTCRNTNMLLWHNELWLIDHGASLYFHHSWDSWLAQAVKPFPYVKKHVLLRQASELGKVDAAYCLLLKEERIQNIVDLIPDEWLTGEAQFPTPAQYRQAYKQYLLQRITHSEIFVNEAQHARETLI